MVSLLVHNESTRKRLYRRDALERIAERVCAGEGFAQDAELSLLLCDDAFITDLNRQYRKQDCPTDVLSFGQSAGPAPEGSPHSMLGDVVISLETVERHCGGERAAMRGEVRLLFCHGLLHLLGYVHDTEDARARMAAKQAEYLGVSSAAAWPAKA